MFTARVSSVQRREVSGAWKSLWWHTVVPFSYREKHLMMGSTGKKNNQWGSVHDRGVKYGACFATFPPTTWSQPSGNKFGRLTNEIAWPSFFSMFTFEKNNKTRGHYPQLGNLLPGVESGSHKSHPDFTTKRRHVIKATGAVKNKLLYRSGSVFFAGGLSWIRTLFF